MREILFRGKRKDNGEWVVSDTFYQCDGKVKIWDEPNRDGYVQVEKDTVEQYTGLTDKNGNKVFEGDIVKNDNGIKTSVEFYRGRYYPFIAFPEYKCWDEEECEVIGNIHDNPEVLGTK